MLAGRIEHIEKRRKTLVNLLIDGIYFLRMESTYLLDTQKINLMIYYSIGESLKTKVLVKLIKEGVNLESYY